MNTSVNARRQLARALQNDHGSVVSRSDARRIVSGALLDLQKSTDANATLDDARQTIEATKTLLGDDPRALGELARFERAAPAVLAGRGTQSAMPDALQRRFLDTFEAHDSLDPASVRVTESFVRPDGGFRFTYRVGDGAQQTGHALPVQGDGYVLSPVDLTPSQVHRVTLEMRAYFDEHYVPNLQMRPGEVQAIRDRIVPDLVLFPEHDAGYDPGGNHPGALVARLANPFSDEGFFVTFDPSRDRYQAYTS